MDGRSEQQLLTVYPGLATKVRVAAEELFSAGTAILVVSGLRTGPQQDSLYAQGRSSPGHIVTNARAGYSMHNYGLAVDVVPFLTGSVGALNWNPETPQFEAMVVALKNQGLIWGGDWISIPDRDHFQVNGLPATPTAAMRADYGDGGMEALRAIWAKYEAGRYAQ